MSSNDARGQLVDVVVLTDHPDSDYPRVSELASLVVDSRNATWGIPAPDGRMVRL